MTATAKKQKPLKRHPSKLKKITKLRKHMVRLLNCHRPYC